MGFFTGNSRKPKPFGFIPRYYDEQKEAREERLKKLKDLDQIDISKDRIRSGLRSTYRGDNDYKKRETKKLNFRLFYIIITLLLVCYMILQSDAIKSFMEKMEG